MNGDIQGPELASSNVIVCERWRKLTDKFKEKAAVRENPSAEYTSRGLQMFMTPIFQD